MILLPFLKIPHGDRLVKNVKGRCVQVISRSMGYPMVLHGLLYTWTEDWIINFLTFIPAKLTKYDFICRFLKDMNFHKIGMV